jgi:hypothetical protein
VTIFEFDRISYDNHPRLKNTLMHESLIWWPLRKDYITPVFYEIQDAHWMKKNSHSIIQHNSKFYSSKDSKVLGCPALFHSNPLRMGWHILECKYCRYFHHMWHHHYHIVIFIFGQQVAFGTKWFLAHFYTYAWCTISYVIVSIL